MPHDRIIPRTEFPKHYYFIAIIEANKRLHESSTYLVSSIPKFTFIVISITVFWAVVRRASKKITMLKEMSECSFEVLS